MGSNSAANQIGAPTGETVYNWAAMFTSYASGSSLEDIADAFACPLPLLRRAATTQDWAAIASRLVTPPALPPKPETDTRLAILERNRAKNYEMADMLRDRLIHDFTQLRNGSLRVEKALVSKGQILHTDVEVGPSDLVALANAAKTVSDMTYRALGDVNAEERQTKGAMEAASITVILPTVVHNHNHQLPDEPKEVIDLRPVEKTIDDAIAERREAAKARAKALVRSVDDGPVQEI